MAFFGPSWENYAQRIQENWEDTVKENDLVLIPGDITWASTLEEAKIDLDWIDKLPGTKVLIKGNHDYWWASNAKMEKALPPSIHFIHNNAFHWNDVSIGGTRLWDTPEYSFNEFITFIENTRENKKETSQEEILKIFNKELERLKTSLRCVKQDAALKIALTHYPPISADLKPSTVSQILGEFNIDVCVFGHLHSVNKGALPFGTAEGIRYVFASADYVDFKLTKIW